MLLGGEVVGAVGAGVDVGGEEVLGVGRGGGERAHG